MLRHPVATKRALRAIVKAADLCALDPQRAARALVDKGYTPRYEYALQVMKELPYGKWREYDPEDTLRFYALRLHEAGMIKASPQKILAQATDWRFLKNGSDANRKRLAARLALIDAGPNGVLASGLGRQFVSAVLATMRANAASPGQERLNVKLVPAGAQKANTHVRQAHYVRERA